MSVLIVGNIKVEDPASLGPYKAAAGPSMKEFGIGVVGQVGPAGMLEGAFPGDITVVLEAESEQVARAWYASDSYAKAIAARSEDAVFTIAIVPRPAAD